MGPRYRWLFAFCIDFTHTHTLTHSRTQGEAKGVDSRRGTPDVEGVCRDVGSRTLVVAEIWMKRRLDESVRHCCCDIASGRGAELFGITIRPTVKRSFDFEYCKWSRTNIYRVGADAVGPMSHLSRVLKQLPESPVRWRRMERERSATLL